MISLNPQTKRKWQDFKKRNGRTILFILVTFLLLLSLGVQIYFWFLGTQADITNIQNIDKESVSTTTITNTYIIDNKTITNKQNLFLPTYYQGYSWNETLSNVNGAWSAWKQFIDENVTASAFSNSSYSFYNQNYSYVCSGLLFTDVSAGIVSNLAHCEIARFNGSSYIIDYEKYFHLTTSEGYFNFDQGSLLYDYNETLFIRWRQVPGAGDVNVGISYKAELTFLDL